MNRIAFQNMVFRINRWADGLFPQRARSRRHLWIEMLLLFAVLPAFGLLHAGRPFVFGLLWAMAVYGFLWLRKKDRKTLTTLPTRLDILVTLFRFALLGLALGWMAWQALPDKFMQLPLQNPRLYLLIIFLYPLLSALPQEIVYRAFFLTRYGSLFKNDIERILASALAFSLAHLAFGNPVALFLSFCGGVLFARSYVRTRSLALVVLKHALYGILIFTIGLGWYFYLGAHHSFLTRV